MFTQSIKWLVIVTCLVYLPKFANDFVWDDYFYIVENQYVQNPQQWIRLFYTNTSEGAGVLSNYYRPLTSLAFGLIGYIFGSSTFGYHLVQLLTHIGAGIILYLFLKELKLNKRVAWWMSLIFLIHPTQVQAVAYMASLGDSLYALFLFGSLWWLAHSFRSTCKQKRLVVLISPLLLLGAILAKEIAIAGIGLWVLVFVHQFLVVSKSGRLRQMNKYQAQLATFLIGCGTVGGYLYIRLNYFNFTNWQLAQDLPVIYYQSLVVRMLTFVKAILYYLRILIWPYPLHFYWDIGLEQVVSRWTIAWIILTLVIFIIGFQEWRGRKSIWIWLGSLWFLGMLVPVSGILPVNGLLYENWLYVPMIGILMCCYGFYKLIDSTKFQLSLIQRISQRLSTNGHKLMIILVCVLGLLTVRQLQFWKDNLTWFTYNLHFGENAYLHNNLASEYIRQKKFPQAQIHAQAAAELDPDLPLPYANLAVIAKANNQIPQVESYYLQALSLRPDYHPARKKLISFYLEQKQYTQAANQTKKLLDFTPDNWEVLVMMGRITYLLDDQVRAEIYFQRALEVSDYDPFVRQTIEAVKIQNQ